MNVRVRQYAWYGDTEVDLGIPDNWAVEVASHRGAPALEDAAIKRAILNPIGSRNLRELASGKRNIVILTEDITRPIQCEMIFKVLLAELNKSGVPDSAITVIIANGTHRPMTRHELLLKLGTDACQRVKILPHNCYDNLVKVGRTLMGTELYINAFAAEADLLIGVGGVYPHAMAGYSGGGKIILPGIAGIQSIEQNHSISGSGYGKVDNNPVRNDMEEASRIAGLSFIINAVVNGDRQICGLFAGEPVFAHRAASRFADEVYRTTVREAPDVAILNAYPMDTELFQAGKAFSVSKNLPSVKVQILLAGCPDGFGYHALCGPGGRFNQREKDNVRKNLGSRQLVICSENVEVFDVRKKYTDDTILCKSWDQVVKFVEKKIGSDKLHVAFFPTATLQLPAELGNS